MSADITPRQAEILSVAADVFADAGYEGGSMREIASRVGVTEPALYRHFANKEELFLAFIRFAAGRMRDETLAMIEQLDPTDLRPQMLELLRDRRRALKLFGPLIRAIFPAAARNERFLEEYRSVIVRPAFVMVSQKAAQIDQAQGVEDAEATRPGRVRALMSLIVGYFVSSFMLGDDPDEVVVDAALRVMRWS